MSCQDGSDSERNLKAAGSCCKFQLVPPQQQPPTHVCNVAPRQRRRMFARFGSLSTSVFFLLNCDYWGGRGGVVAACWTKYFGQTLRRISAPFLGRILGRDAAIDLGGSTPGLSCNRAGQRFICLIQLRYRLPDKSLKSPLDQRRLSDPTGFPFPSAASLLFIARFANKTARVRPAHKSGREEGGD